MLDPDGLVARPLGCSRRSPIEDASAPPILVIDDSLTTRMLEQSILESAGYDVDLADSRARRRSRRRAEASYALFLVDVEMPGMDGFTFVEHVRADPALRDIPAILVTSRSVARRHQRAASGGRRAGAT